MGELKLIGHRGYGPTHNDNGTDALNYSVPENSLAAFKYALDSGANGIEIDVRLSKDGVPVVIHDDELGRHIASGRGECGDFALNVRDLIAVDIQKFDIGGGQYIPTLREVLDLCAEYDRMRPIINLDVKDGQCVGPIFSTLMSEDYRNTNLIVSSYNWEILRKSREKSGDIQVVPAIRSRILFGEDNVQMPGYLPMVSNYQETAKQRLIDLHGGVGYAALDCTFTDFRSELAVWADELGVGLMISTGSDRVSAKDMDYDVLLYLDNIAENYAHVPFVICKVDEPDLVRARLDELRVSTISHKFEIEDDFNP